MLQTLDLIQQCKLICKRRNKQFVRIESVALGGQIGGSTTIADLTSLLASGATHFYFIERLLYTVFTAQATASICFRVTNHGNGGSTGAVDLITGSALGTAGQWHNIETNDLIYIKNGSTAGYVMYTGTAYKITYA